NQTTIGGISRVSRSKASKVMMDQQNLEAARPASADPDAVALAKALGQWPKTPATKAPPAIKAPPANKAKPSSLADRVAAKTAAPSVESLAEEHGLKLGDQNELTIRRIKRGKNYSFVRANGRPIRHTGTIKRLHSMAVR